MITIFPHGGIGNQLFQYAAGRSLSLARGAVLEVDCWHFGTDPASGSRPLLLDKLQLPALFRTYDSRWYNHPDRIPQRIRRRLLPWIKPVIDETPGFTIETFLNAPACCALQGYFQSFGYFDRFEGEIRREIDLRLIASVGALTFARQHDLSTTCALQVRRGDYVGNSFFDVIDPNTYFSTAINIVKAKVSKARFIVFSDDPSWCKSQPVFAGMMIHEEEPHSAGDAMYIMSRCRDHIISNSSYGWWAAFLAEGDGCVVAPRLWFSGTETRAKGLALSGWVLI